MDYSEDIKMLDKDLDLINHTKKILRMINGSNDYVWAQWSINRLETIQSDLEKIKLTLSQSTSPRYISKMLQQSKTTDEKLSTNEDNIRVVEFKNEDQAEDFVESLWNK